MDAHETHHHPERWATRFGVILAVAGSAVGLGNFLRFPGEAAANGGGAFMIPYFAALLLVGIPMAWAEWTMARYGGSRGMHSAPAIYGILGRAAIWRYLGVLGVLIPLAVSFYYTFVEAWCLGYVWHYLTGGIGIDPNAPVDQQAAVAAAFFNDFTGTAADGVVYGGSHETLIFWIVTFAANIWLVRRGLSGGIEKFTRYAMPLMAVAACFVLIRVLTLGTPDPARPDQNVVNGLAYMWNPDFTALANPQTWLAAAGQIFFSLSIGFGIIINYASYLTKRDDVVLSGLTAVSTNELFEVGFGGLITLTASFIFLGLSGTAAAVATGSFGLGFNTLPVVFAHMGPVGNFIGAVWFFMLFLAAITSSISMYQPALAFFREALGLGRNAGVLLIVIVCGIGSFLTMYYSRNGTFQSTLNNWVGTLLIVVLALIQMIIFSWIFGVERGMKEAHEGAEMRIPGFYRSIMKWVTPLYLLIIFVSFSYANLGDWIRAVMADFRAQMAMALLAAVTILLLLMVRIGEKRWRAAGIDINDESAYPSRSAR